MSRPLQLNRAVSDGGIGIVLLTALALAACSSTAPPSVPLAVETGRRAPDPGAGEAGREIVVDPVGDVLDRRAGIERQGLLVRRAVRAKLDPD